MHADTGVLKKKADNSNSCLALAGLPDGCNVPSDFASNYGLDKLYDKGADGSGQTLAIVTLAALDPTAPDYYWKNIAHVPATGRTLTVDNVDGGPGAPSDAAGSGESDLDVEQSGALAPGANVIVYQAPNTDAGFADAFYDAASQNVASTVSASWLESETYLQSGIASGAETPGYQAAFDEAFLEMAAQGQSGFIASGDQGAYTATVDLGTTNLSVATSADSPYITAAGGTTLPWSGHAGRRGRHHGQRARDEPAHLGLGLPVAAAGDDRGRVARGLGGVEHRRRRWRLLHDRAAALVPVRRARHRRVPRGTVPDADRLHHGQGHRRPGRADRVELQPDAEGDLRLQRRAGRCPTCPPTPTRTPATCCTSRPRRPSARRRCRAAWGGTSFVAPQLNGSTAVIDSYLGHRVGLWNPSIYAFATGGTVRSRR